MGQNGSPPGAAAGRGGKRHPKHEDEELGKLFVGGLSWETTGETLLRYFSRFGDVIDCVVMKNAETGRSRGFGFVTFSDPNNIELVIQSSPHNLDGRTIDPKPCNPRSMQKPKKNTNWPKIFLGGLPSSITETDLRSFFGRYGDVTEVVIMYDQEKKKSRGFGFLSFREDAAVDQAVAEHFVNIQNKQVEIKRAEPRNDFPVDIGSGPVVDQWGTPPISQTGLEMAIPTESAYSGWGAPPQQISTVPPTGHPYGTQPEYSTPPNHWGGQPPAQPPTVRHNPQHAAGWGAPPGPPPQTTYQTTSVPQPTQYVSSTYAPPIQPHTQPLQQHTYGTSYWGSPPGPTPPTTPLDPYSQKPPHQSSPQSKYDYNAASYPHHPPPTDFARVFTAKPPQATAPPPAPTSTDYYFRPPMVDHSFFPPPDPVQGPQRGGTFPPPLSPITSYHPYHRT